MGNDTKTICGNWAYVGMTQGLGRGVMLAYGYMVLPLLFAVVAFLWQFCMELNTVMLGGESRLLAEPMTLMGGIFLGLIFVVFYGGFGTVFGAIPAAIFGAISGALLGAVLALPHIARYRWNRLAVGTGIAFVIAALVNQIAISVTFAQNEEQWGAYLFFIGLPSLVYLGVCIWLSDSFPRLVADHQYRSTLPKSVSLPYHHREYPVLTPQLKETGKEG